VSDSETRGPDERAHAGESAHASGLPVFADDGTDLTVIRWMLGLSPDDRLRWLQNHMRAVARIGHVQQRP